MKPKAFVLAAALMLTAGLRPTSEHGFECWLVFVRDGHRVVGYDNERGKGDHRHFLGREFAYRFTSADQLIADFLADVENARRYQ